MMIAVLLALAVVPSLLLLAWFRSRDLRPEPRRVVWATFGLGALALAPEVIVATPFGRYVERLADPLVQGLFGALFVAAIPEEIFKLLVLMGYAMRRSTSDELMHGVVYGVAASLGFATLENVMYVLQGGGGIAVFRALTAVPAHAFMGAILGYYAGQAKRSPTHARALLAKGGFLAIALHATYDFPLLVAKHLKKKAGPEFAREKPIGMALSLLSVAALIGAGVATTRLVRRLRHEQEALTPRDAE